MNRKDQEALIKGVMSMIKYWVVFEEGQLLKKVQCAEALNLLKLDAHGNGWYNAPEFTGVNEPRMTIAARKTEESAPALRFLAKCGWHHDGEPTTTATDVSAYVEWKLKHEDYDKLELVLKLDFKANKDQDECRLIQVGTESIPSSTRPIFKLLCPGDEGYDQPLLEEL